MTFGSILAATDPVAVSSLAFGYCSSSVWISCTRATLTIGWRRSSNEYSVWNRARQSRLAWKSSIYCEIICALAFIYGHRQAEQKFKQFIVSSSEGFSAEENLVLQESQAEIEKAETWLSSVDTKEIILVISVIGCLNLLTDGAQFVENLSGAGLLTRNDRVHRQGSGTSSWMHCVWCGGQKRQRFSSRDLGSPSKRKWNAHLLVQPELVRKHHYWPPTV